MPSPARLIPNAGHRDAVLGVSMALIAIGVVMVASAGATLEESVLASIRFQTPFGRQLVFAAAGVCVMLAASRLATFVLARERVLAFSIKLVVALAMLGLVAAWIPGIASPQRSSHRWLAFTVGAQTLHVQPSELAKLALVLLLARLLSTRDEAARPDRRVASWRGFLPCAATIGLGVALVGKADFGTSVLLAVVGFLLLLIGGCRIRHLATASAVGISGLAVLLLAEPYRLKRLVAFRSLMDDPLGAGYQPLQSLTAIASGGWFGVGLGAGVGKYGYLPEAHTDFIFAVICEETGFFGAAVVIALFCVLTFLGARAMWSARTSFERLAAFGITSLIGWQAVMNIAVVTVMAPTTGISLPLVSAGGSGLLTFCAAIGLLAAIASRSTVRSLAAETSAGFARRGAPVAEFDGGAIHYGAVAHPLSGERR